jgi:hypothetical protein
LPGLSSAASPKLSPSLTQPICTGSACTQTSSALVVVTDTLPQDACTATVVVMYKRSSQLCARAPQSSEQHQ